MTNLIIKAAQYAANAHEGQTRKYTGAPYITHPIRVAGRVAIRPDATEIMVAAAFLHDVLEDTPITQMQMAAALGPQGDPVTMLVIQLTNASKSLKAPRKERKRMDVEYLAKASHEAKIIKMIDRIDNLQEMDPKDAFGVLYSQESLELVNAIGDADPALRAELMLTIGEMRSDVSNTTS